MNDELTCAWNQEQQTRAQSDSIQESSWIAASQRGDTLAFNRLVLKWERTVYNLALRMLQDRDEAAEATQEVFFSAFKNIRRFRRDAKLSTWLYRIAINHCISRAKRRPAGAHIAIESDREALPQPQLCVKESQDDEVLRTENRSRVRAALAFLPPDQRAVVELKFIQELTFEDIAAVLEVPLSTVKSRLYAGLEMLKVRLGTRV